MRTVVNLRVSQKLIFDEVDASFAARASRSKYSTSENVEKNFSLDREFVVCHKKDRSRTPLHLYLEGLILRVIKSYKEISLLSGM